MNNTEDVVDGFAAMHGWAVGDRSKTQYDQILEVTCLTALLSEDTQWQCTSCGRIGSVGRCCGVETRKPLNDAARKEERPNLATADQTL